MSNFESPIPLSEIEAVLTWVDTFKLSRPTKKINRDFSDAVLLAEILNVHYPKLVEMHNYPPRNSHALKLNNWMTLNRKVLKKLKINLCCKTMEQLANCAPGIIERVLIMVHDRIKRDEELNKSLKDSEQNVSSGGSYYEACGDDDQILVVPVKTRVNGVLETVHQKVVSHDTYLALKEELKDVKESADVLKQKVEHLDSLLKLKDERIDELQNQLDRKAARRKEVEVFQNSLNVPFDNIVSPIPIKTEDLQQSTKIPSLTSIEINKTKLEKDESLTQPNLEQITTPKENISRIPVAKSFEDTQKSALITETKIPILKVPDVNSNRLDKINIVDNNVEVPKAIGELFRKTSVQDFKLDEIMKRSSHGLLQPSSAKIEIPGNATSKLKEDDANVHKVKSDVFEEALVDMERPLNHYHDTEEFKDSEQDSVVTIEETIHEEIRDIHLTIKKSNPQIIGGSEIK